MSRYSKARFLKSAMAAGTFGDDSGYEVAIAGRSNSGKSTALNAIVRQHGLARTSRTPGRTQAVNLFELAMWQKEIKGTIFGSLNPRADIPKLLGLYRDGQLKLDELITRRYPLEQINEGYEAMRNGENIRGVVVHV